MNTYVQIKYAMYAEDNVSATLTRHGGNYGGGSEMLIVTHESV